LTIIDASTIVPSMVIDPSNVDPWNEETHP